MQQGLRAVLEAEIVDGAVFALRSGGAYPGTHAEFVVVNDLLSAGADLDDIVLSTIRGKGGSALSVFDACEHCTRILGDRVTVLTGLSDL